MKSLFFRVLLAAPLLISLSSIPALAQSGSGSGNINFLLGTKTLDDDDWEPVEDHSEFGLKMDFQPPGWPLSFAIDLRRSVSDEESIILFDPVFGSLEFEVEGETTEFNIGVRKIFDEFSIIRPFLGGGLSFIDGEFSASVPGFGSISESGNGTGIWFSGGVYFTFAGHLNLGLELGFSTAEIEIVDEDVEAGGSHIGFLVGYHWGGSSQDNY